MFNEVIFGAFASLYMFRHANVIGQSACRWDKLTDDEKKLVSFAHTLTSRLDANEASIKANDLHLAGQTQHCDSHQSIVRTEAATKCWNMCTSPSIILCSLFSFVSEYHSVTVVKYTHRESETICPTTYCVHWPKGIYHASKFLIWLRCLSDLWHIREIITITKH